jgi:hypothetical protein
MRQPTSIKERPEMRQSSRDRFFLRAILSDAWSAVTARPAGFGHRSVVLAHARHAQRTRTLDEQFIDADARQRMGRFDTRGVSARNLKA